MDLNFCRKYTGHILNSLFASCASWFAFSSEPSSSLHSSSYCTHFTLTSKNLRTRLWLLSWRSRGEVTVTVQSFSFTTIRHQNMYPHITHTKHLLFFITLLHKAMISNGGSDKIVKASKSVIILLQSNGSKSVESGTVCVFVTWKLSMLLHGADNLDTISDETEQLRNARIGCHVWKRLNMWPIDNTWHSNHVFICDPMAKC
jgi:hypothetical protein